MALLDGNGSGIKLPLSIVIALVIAISGAIWTLQTDRQEAQLRQNECITGIQKDISRNQRDIKSITTRVERLEKSLEGLPEKITEMSTDIRYLRQSVELWNKKLMKEWDAKDD